MFFNKGENCIAAGELCILFNAPHHTYKPRPPTGRLFVERHAHQEFVERMVEEVAKMKIGDPLDRSVTHGPQNHK